MTQSRELSRALFNPAFPHAAKKQILAQMSAGADELVRSALFVLVDNKRLDALADVVARRARGRPPRAPPARARADDGRADRRRRGRGDPHASWPPRSGHEVTLERSVDSAILGGVIVRVRDRMVDLSVRGRLEALRLSLRNARLGSTGGES